MKNTVVIVIMALLLTCTFVLPYGTLMLTVAAETADEESTVVKVTGGSVYVRSGPGVNNSKLGVVYKGSTFTYLGEKKLSSGRIWYKIKFGNKEGWITSRYSDKVGLSSDSGSGSGTSSGDYVKITGSAVNVREGAGVKNNKIGVVYKGNSYKYLDEEVVNGITWYKIQYKSDTEGWVCGSYAKRTGSGSGTGGGSNSYTPPPADGSKVKVTGSAVNVRKGPGVSNAKIGLAYKGNTYDYLDIKIVNGVAWYKIQFSSSKTGWICGKYCTIIPPADGGSGDNGGSGDSDDNGGSGDNGDNGGSGDNGDNGDSGNNDEPHTPEWATADKVNGAVDELKTYVGELEGMSWDDSITYDQSVNDSVKTAVNTADCADEAEFLSKLKTIIGNYKSNGYTKVNSETVQGSDGEYTVNLYFVA